MRLILKLIAGLLLLVVIALVAVIFFIDPNKFKPAIEEAAKSKSIDLEIQGDLKWQLWPNFGFAVEGVSVSGLSSNNLPIAQLKQASFLLALKPLFSGEFRAYQFIIDGAAIRLFFDETGRGNWQDLFGQEESSGMQKELHTDNSLDLLIEQVKITNSELEYTNPNEQQIVHIRELNATFTEVNTSSQPMQVALDGLIDVTGKDSNGALRIKSVITSRVTVSEDLSRVSIEDGDITFALGKNKNEEFQLKYSVQLENLKSSPKYGGELEIQSFNARSLLAALGLALDTTNSTVLENLSFRSQFGGDSTQMTLDAISIASAETRLVGKAAVDFITPAFSVALSGNRINLDAYLPVPKDTHESEKDVKDDVAQLPLESLRELNTDFDLSLESVIVKNLKLENIKLGVRAKGGRIREDFSARAYGGDLVFTSISDVRGANAKVNFSGEVGNLELTPLLADMKLNQKLNFSGALNLDLSGYTEGSTFDELVNSIDAQAGFSGAQMRLAPLNIEEKFCHAVSLITKASADKSWDDFTELKEFHGNFAWKNQTIQLEDFKAGVSQFLVGSTGSIHLASDEYIFKLPITFTSLDTVKNFDACQLSGTNYWFDRGLSLLRCRGTFTNIQPLKDCGFDSKGIKKLAKDFAEYKLRKEHGKKLDAAERKLQEKKKEINAKKEAAKLDVQEGIEEEKERAKNKVDEKKDELLNKLIRKLDRSSGDK